MGHKLSWAAQEATKKKYDVSGMPVPSNRQDDLTNKPAYLKSVRNKVQAMEYGYPDSSSIQKHTLEYYSVITEMDGFIDDLLREVTDLLIEENTYIFFLSDNGWMLGDHGFTSKVLPYPTEYFCAFYGKRPGDKI